MMGKLSLFLIMCCSCLVMMPAAGDDQFSQTKPIRIGLTPALLNYQHSLNVIWQEHLQQQLQRPVEFVQRDTYSETMELLRQKKLDFAWICSYAFIKLGDAITLVAVPLYQGNTNYRSFLIVPSVDTTTRSIADIKGRIFAYADPLSNSGYLVPRYDLKMSGYDPDTFFKRTFFTWAHRKVIEAVANQVANGGAVDSYIWESLNVIEPELTGKTRIVSQSKEFSFAPFVANSTLSDIDLSTMQQILLKMPDTETGRLILDRLNLDGFILGTPQMYDSVAEMARAVGK